MDKSWLTIPRNFEAYTAGINLFLDQAVANGVGPDKFRCLCKRCCNRYTFVRNTIIEHLILYDMDKDYKNACWRHHGEQNIGEQNVAIGEEETGDEVIGMHDFLNDVLVQPLTEESVGPSTELSIGEGRLEEVETFFRFLEEANQDLWLGCKKFKKLEAVVRLYQIKCLAGMSDEIFTTLLELIKRTLPEGDCLPKSCYKAKKLINDLGRTYVKIDACPNDCMIYWKDTLDLTVCSVCGPRSPGKEIDVYMRPLIDELNELWKASVDVMHIEKNICDSVVGTLLGIEKSKDGLATRVDLEVLNIRRSQHLRRKGNRTFLPLALFTLKREEKTAFCNVLSTIRVPDGYSSNFSRCVHLLPLALRLILPKAVTMVLLELSAIFRQMCSKTESEEGFKELSSRIALTLCKLEKIFRPAFFNIMVHLPVHLADESALAGPVPYKWMYPIERAMFVIRVVLKVLLLKHIWWMSVCPSVPCILEVSSLVVPVEAEMKMVLDVECLMNSSYHANDTLISQDLHWLANYPSRVVSRYKSHIVHGFIFCIKYVDDKHKNQNCGVFVPANVPGAIGQVNCYGRVVDMFEVKYSGLTEAGDRGRAVMLFKCELVNSESPQGMKTDQYGFTMVNFNQLGFKDDHFILASQALQVFYLEDTIEKDWHVVVRTQPRDLFDVLEDSDAIDAIDDYAIPNLDDRILDNENFHTRVGVEETHFLESLALPTEFVNHANVDDELTYDDME
ncbi:unnamed protein product [Malus baccata var. baccata]